MTKPTAQTLNACAVWFTAAMLAVTFALCTNHAWEDYWITFRASKNLATGNGLVFQLGEHVHTFTSPLGVLLPALASLLTGNHSDSAALWLFRAMSIAAFASAVTLVFATCTRLGWHRWAVAIAVLWAMVDAKSLDFTINGMETGVLLCFLAYTLWAMLACTHRQWLHLGAAWAGLMWSRPDGFVYIAALGAGALLFNPRSLPRSEQLRLLLQAAAVCAILYLPWFIGAWVYYGTPVPNTVTAKAAIIPPHSLSGAALALLKMPFTCWGHRTAQTAVFLPPDYFYDGWPLWLERFSTWLASAGMLLWMLPRMTAVTRLASFTAFIFTWYLSYFSNPAAWYWPPVTWLLIFAFASLLTRALHSKLCVVPGMVVVLFALVTAAAGRQIAVQQRAIEWNHRREIGLWLRDHAQPGDKVFLECLGYIGYFSNLKMLDYPGLSAPEVVRVVKESGADWPPIIAKLQPDWLVLRPAELSLLAKESAVLQSYELRKEFNVLDQVESLDIMGRGYLEYDSVFFVLQRKPSA